jgi:hypothetical protein
MKARSVLLWLIPLALIAVWVFSLMGPNAQPGVAAATPQDEPSPAAEPPIRAQAVPRPEPPAAPIAAPAPALPAPQHAPAVPPAPPPPAVAPSASQAVAQRRPPSELFSAAFLEEERDSLWAGQAEQQVRAAFQKANVPPGTVLAVQCRSTLCKVDFMFDRRQHLAFAMATHELRTHFSGDMSLDSEVSPTNLGPERMTAYLPRQGQTLKDYE